MNYKITKKKLHELISWQEGKNIAFTKKEVVEMAYLLLKKKSGDLYLPRPSTRSLGNPRGKGLRVTAHLGLIISNTKIHYFDVSK